MVGRCRGLGSCRVSAMPTDRPYRHHCRKCGRDFGTIKADPKSCALCHSSLWREPRICAICGEEHNRRYGRLCWKKECAAEAMRIGRQKCAEKKAARLAATPAKTCTECGKEHRRQNTTCCSKVCSDARKDKAKPPPRVKAKGNDYRLVDRSACLRGNTQCANYLKKCLAGYKWAPGDCISGSLYEPEEGRA